MDFKIGWLFISLLLFSELALVEISSWDESQPDRDILGGAGDPLERGNVLDLPPITVSLPPSLRSSRILDFKMGLGESSFEVMLDFLLVSGVLTGVICFCICWLTLFGFFSEVTTFMWSVPPDFLTMLTTSSCVEYVTL